MTVELLRVRVAKVTREADDINAYELVDLAGGLLPAFAAGSHIDVHVGEGLVRQYSLCNAPGERDRYVIGVLREMNGRGGSAAMFDRVRAGTTLEISPPRNLFPLVASARSHLLLAGGIGITPMLAMVAQLEQDRADYTLHYCTRAPEKTAFRGMLSAVAQRVRQHHDGGDPRNGLDIASLLRDHVAGTHLYYCGPPGFMAAVKAASEHWPQATTHCEYFTAPRAAAGPAGVSPASAALAPLASGPAAEPAEFRVRLQKSGAEYEVPRDKSIVQVLREHGVEVETSCESGLCGTCRTRYFEGEPVHNDYVLADDEREEFVMICCARSSSALLVLDR